jgi:hypothetical protein
MSKLTTDQDLWGTELNDELDRLGSLPHTAVEKAEALSVARHQLLITGSYLDVPQQEGIHKALSALAIIGKE